MSVHFSSATDQWATPKAVYDALEAENGRLRAALQTLLESAYPAITPPPDDCVDFMIDEYFILEGDVAATIKAELAAVQALGSQHEA